MQGTNSTRGAYDAERAAALSGVPLSTLYYWARREIYRPSVSWEKVKLWSWGDLLAVRAIYWLRSHKPEAERPTTMNEVRNFLNAVEQEFSERVGEALANKRLILRVDPAGHCYMNIENVLARTVSRDALQLAAPELVVDLLDEYVMEGRRGPHLLSPRPRLRIIPGKLGGEPHVKNTRLETRTIMGLLSMQRSAGDVLELYPFLDAQDVQQAEDLENQLCANLGKQAVA